MAVNNLEGEGVVILIFLVLKTVIWKEGTVAKMIDTCDSTSLQWEPAGGFCKGGRS